MRTAFSWTFYVRGLIQNAIRIAFHRRLSYDEIICHSIEPVDEVLWCYHLNKTSLGKLLNNAIYFLGIFTKKEFSFVKYFFTLATIQSINPFSPRPSYDQMICHSNF